MLSAVVKVHTAHVAVTTLREGLESFGGAGYMEVGFVSKNIYILFTLKTFEASSCVEQAL